MLQTLAGRGAGRGRPVGRAAGAAARPRGRRGGAGRPRPPDGSLHGARPTPGPAERPATGRACRDAPAATAAAAPDGGSPDGGPATAWPAGVAGTGRYQWVTFAAPAGRTRAARLVGGRRAPDDATDLLEDAAHSLRMALEREQALVAHQEAMALRHSRELQQTFLRRLSHELRTPLTAITGYATSPAAAGRDLGRRLRAAVPVPHRGRVGPARPPRQRPARLLRDRVRRVPAAGRLVRHPAGARRRHRGAAARGRVAGRGQGGARPARDLGRPRPARAGLREPARQRPDPQPAADPGGGHRRRRPGTTTSPSGSPTTATGCRRSWPGAVTEAARGRDPRWHEVLAAGIVRPASGPGRGRARAVHRRRYRGRSSAAESSCSRPTAARPS